MASFNDTASMALFCDFENIALGVRDAQYEKFDIRPVLERLLAKGSIVVKKAYCDWERYKGFKAAMHEANFELIEIPHVRQSGKNSADIRMVVDALDLCYTKSHVDTFVIISGDSDFSPLVSKLRENAKKVIGVGVKQSCSDLLVTNCDEFIYYDDLVRDREASRGPRREREKRSPEEELKRKEKQEERKSKGIDIVHATFVDLIADRGDSERIWASVLKEVVKRRNPGFNESYFGFRTFGNLLEEAAARGLLGFGRDDKGAFVFRAPARPAGEVEVAVAAGEGEIPSVAEPVTVDAATEAKTVVEPATEGRSANGRRRGGRRGRGKESAGEGAAETGAESGGAQSVSTTAAAPVEADSQAPLLVVVGTPVADSVEAAEASPAPAAKRGARKPRKRADSAPAGSDEAGVVVEAVAAQPATAAPTDAAVEAAGEPAKKAARRPARTPRARKPKAAAEN